MPKERMSRSISVGNSRASPMVPSSSPTDKEKKEWDEACCPGCLDPPHNAVLLVCSSFENGCRPYMCGTSIRHSNCFMQFLKSSKEKELSNTIVASLGEEVANDQGGGLAGLHLKCPLCRGDVLRWLVVKDARLFMNLKVRTCSVDKCEYTGTFYELRTHGWYLHKKARPSEGEIERQISWRSMERQRATEDMLAGIRGHFGERTQLLEDGQIVFDGQGMPRFAMFTLNHEARVTEVTSHPRTRRRSRDWRPRVRARRSTPSSSNNVREIIVISDDEEE